MVALVWWRRWRRTWEAEHHMIHRGPIVMVLMMLMIVHIANVHIIAHRWMQRERLGVVVREAGDLRAVAPQDVLLVLLLLEAINIKAIALITRSIVLLSFLLRLRGSLRLEVGDAPQLELGLERLDVRLQHAHGKGEVVQRVATLGGVRRRRRDYALPPGKRSGRSFARRPGRDAFGASGCFGARARRGGQGERRRSV